MRFEILQRLSVCENALGPSRNGPLVLILVRTEVACGKKLSFLRLTTQSGACLQAIRFDTRASMRPVSLTIHLFLLPLDLQSVTATKRDSRTSEELSKEFKTISEL